MSALDTPLRLPLVNSIQTRDETLLKDAKLVNCYVELDPRDNEYWIEKRPGLRAGPAYALGAGNGLGLYHWSTQVGSGTMYAVKGNTLYKGGVALGAVTGGNLMYHFVQIRSVPPLLVLGNGVDAYYTDGTTITKIIDANFPTSFVPGWAYLDGTLYVMDYKGNIFGSKNLDDPVVWDALNKIVARIEPDGGVALAKQLTYVIALKQWTTEVFYDAGNATGSPLAQLPGGFFNYGCLSGETLQEIDGILIWASSNKSASTQVVRVDNLQLTVISTPPVERLLAQAVQFGSEYHSLVVKHAGHRFYILSLQVLNLTLCYDLDQNLWYPWTDPDGNWWKIVAQSYEVTGNHLVQHATNGNIYFLRGDYSYPNDAGVTFAVDIVTSNFDGGLDRRKMLSMMRVNADQVPDSTLQLRVSDDDYQTWSNFRSFDLSQVRPVLTDLGTFYRRAFHFRHFANTSFRIKSADLQLDRGTL